MKLTTSVIRLLSVTKKSVEEGQHLAQARIEVVSSETSRLETSISRDARRIFVAARGRRYLLDKGRRLKLPRRITIGARYNLSISLSKVSFFRPFRRWLLRVSRGPRDCRAICVRRPRREEKRSEGERNKQCARREEQEAIDSESERWREGRRKREKKEINERKRETVAKGRRKGRGWRYCSFSISFINSGSTAA